MSEAQYFLITIIIQVIASILTLVGLIFACIQLWQIKVNRKRQFEQARREKTVEMVMNYSNNMNGQTKAIEKIVCQLTDEQCQDLYNGTEFHIDRKIRNQLCDFCPHKEICNKEADEVKCKSNDSDNEYVVRGEVLYFLRSNIINYLNSLESVLLSWQLGIVDQNALQEQFAFLDKKRHKERAVETFRMIAGNGQSYPAIEKFYQYLDQKNSDEAKKSLKEILK